MKDIFSKCGFNCGRCPSYRENINTHEDRQRCSDGWYTYHGFRITPEKIRRCDGCQTPDDQNPLLYFKYGCNIRKCAIENGVKTCAHCSGYPCEDVNANSIDVEEIAARVATPIPEEDYRAFVEPYEGLTHLTVIRRSLVPEDIVEMSRFSVDFRIVDFPDGLPFSTEEISAFKAVHQLIATVNPITDVSYARQHVLKKRRQHLIKLLWAFGLLGELGEDGSLILDSSAYSAQKIHSSYSRVLYYCDILKEYGVHCEHVPLTEEKYGKKGWLTPTGALRKTGWYLKMYFGENTGGIPALKALQHYAAGLDKEFGKNAFRRFSKADMQILKEKR
jgi:hypothetical protein